MSEFFYFYLVEKIEADRSVLTGAEVKATIKARVPSLDVSHDLVLEGHGHDQDRAIRDDEPNDLSHGHGQGPKHFFTRPPTSFGRV
ncbi:hypothetical protein [Mesorhizobium captivum]|uniref:hypothetical protein n=1 Tax=Mesorhizobium captivum TaxID=3072319 RepID=UPI002A2446F6|nr:hypothetical protein [Mesorhizobium sp. VK3C]MDX8450581.1 hypothetical protein [Mesorhizobium sp. VK3C]